MQKCVLAMKKCVLALGKCVLAMHKCVTLFEHFLSTVLTTLSMLKHV